MQNIVLICLFFSIYLMPAPVMAARPPQFNLVDEYGPKLDQVSFKERYAFKKQYSKDWYKSTLEERKEFLEAFHADQAASAKRKAEMSLIEAKNAKISAREKALQENAKEFKARAEANAAKLAAEKAESAKRAATQRHDQLIKQMETLHKRDGVRVNE